jgi:flagellar motor switch/type III secretory pathway protein FliN
VTGARFRPFPWKSLEPVSRAEVVALRDAKCWAARHVKLDRLTATLRELLGDEVTACVDRAQPIGLSQPMKDGVGVVLARAADANPLDQGPHQGDWSALVEAETPLVADVVSRALRRPAPPVVRAGATPSPAVAGAFAAFVLAASRRAHAGKALRLLAAGPAGDLEAHLARRDPERWSLSLTILVGENAYAARVVVPRDIALTHAAPSQWDRKALAALGSVPLALPIVACAASATAAEVATLRAGDAFVPPLSRRIESLAGPVLLAGPSSELGLRAELGEDGRLVLGGTLEPLVGAETQMASEDHDALTTALGDVPVVVRVEIGEAVMSAREWASLSRGDVVALSRAVGGPVVLRVGGVPVARGELVDLEGEVAVRIVERLAPEGTRP